MESPSQQLWSSLTAVDHYLAYDLLEQMSGAESFGGRDMKPILRAATTLRETKPFISAALAAQVDTLLGKLEVDINKFLDVLRVAIRENDGDASKDHVIKQLAFVLEGYRSGMQQVGRVLQKEQQAKSPVPNNPWVAGSFYLFVVVIVGAGLLTAAKILPLVALPVVVIGAVVALAVVGALQLRNDGRLKEEPFLKVMALSFKYLPLLRRRDPKVRRRGPNGG